MVVVVVVFLCFFLKLNFFFIEASRDRLDVRNACVYLALYFFLSFFLSFFFFPFVSLSFSLSFFFPYPSLPHSKMGKFEELLQPYLIRDLKSCESRETLFRCNTTCTQMMTSMLNITAGEYLCLL